MKPVRQSIAQTTCLSLIREIGAGRWEGSLPSIRTLSDLMQVSRQTIINALLLLEEAGYVKAAKQNKPREINQRKINSLSKSKSNSKTETKLTSYKVCIVSWRPLNGLTLSDTDLCNRMQKAIIARGYDYEHLVYSDLTSSKGAKALRSFIIQNPANVYIVMGAHPACSKVLKEMGVPVVFLGGEEAPNCYPRVSFSLKHSCTSLLEHLISVGHQRISVMLPEVLNRNNQANTRTENYIREIFEQHGLSFSNFNCPRWGKTREDYQDAIEKLFAVTPPTAIIMGDCSHVPRVVSYLMRNGLRYPDDVSLAVMDYSSDLFDYMPAISHIRHSLPSLASLAMSQVKQLLTSQKPVKQELTVAKSELVITGSIEHRA